MAEPVIFKKKVDADELLQSLEAQMQDYDDRRGRILRGEEDYERRLDDDELEKAVEQVLSQSVGELIQGPR